MELHGAVKISQELVDKLHDVSGRLDEIAHSSESHCQLPADSEVDLPLHISQKKVF